MKEIFKDELQLKKERSSELQSLGESEFSSEYSSELEQMAERGNKHPKTAAAPTSFTYVRRQRSINHRWQCWCRAATTKARPTSRRQAIIQATQLAETRFSPANVVSTMSMTASATATRTAPGAAIPTASAAAMRTTPGVMIPATGESQYSSVRQRDRAAHCH